MDRERLRLRFPLGVSKVGEISTISFKSSSEVPESSWDSMLN